MKYLVSIFLFCFYLTGLAAQEKHFVFIQADNSQPFYVSLNGKLYSSTANGYVILSRLTDGTYNFSIGFAKNAFPEQGFQVAIDNKDLGFNLKNFGEKGWGLFNLQSLNVTMGDTSSVALVAKPAIENTAPKDDFEPLISFDKKKKPAKPKKEPDALANETAATNEKPKEQQADLDNSGSKENTAILAMPDVRKVSETKDEDGIHLSYSTTNGNATDTILVSIPSVKSSNNENEVSSSEKAGNESDAVSASKPVATESAEPAKDSLKFLDFGKDSLKKDESHSSAEKENNSAAITNSKCTNIATDEDFIRLRRKMAMQATDEKMINEAKKLYRNKCLTTVQIKSLSTLFLSDEGRYNFFNASYNSVTDASQYSALESEFVDPTYVNRFKAMLQ